MSIKNFFITGTLATILSLTASSALADLHITNHSNLSNISVACTGPFPGVPIVKGQTATLQWGLVEMIIGGPTGSCSFYNNGTLEAKASIQLFYDDSGNPVQAQITDLYKSDQKLQVSLNPGVQVSTSNISVTVSGG